MSDTEDILSENLGANRSAIHIQFGNGDLLEYEWNIPICMGEYAWIFKDVNGDGKEEIVMLTEHYKNGEPTEEKDMNQRFYKKGGE